MRSLNLTAPRKAVLELVRTAKDHPTATDIMDRLVQEGNRFAYATVYNSLKYLTDHNLIRELNVGNGITRYDGRMEEHQHIICERCGAITETAIAISDTFMNEVENETGYKIHELDILLTGICPTCRAKGEN